MTSVNVRGGDVRGVRGTGDNMYECTTILLYMRPHNEPYQMGPILLLRMVKSRLRLPRVSSVGEPAFDPKSI